MIASAPSRSAMWPRSRASTSPGGLRRGASMLRGVLRPAPGRSLA